MQLLNIHLLIGKNKVTILPSSVQIIKIIDRFKSNKTQF